VCDPEDGVKNTCPKCSDKMKAQMESGQKPDSAQMVAMREYRQKAAASYRAVLTPDQQKIFDKNIADMQEKMRSMATAGAEKGK
jgi:hypothetical protein